MCREAAWAELAVAVTSVGWLRSRMRGKKKTEASRIVPVLRRSGSFFVLSGSPSDGVYRDGNVTMQRKKPVSKRDKTVDRK